LYSASWFTSLQTCVSYDQSLEHQICGVGTQSSQLKDLADYAQAL